MEAYKLSNSEMEYLGYFTSGEGHIRTQRVKTRKGGYRTYFLDCEMIETTLGTEVVSIGIGYRKEEDNLQENKDQDTKDIEWRSHTIKVQPKGDVIDYITHITGFDKDSTYDMSMEQALEFVLSLVDIDDVLVGHHLYLFLEYLNIYHPNVVDTCMLFHHPDGPPQYYSLKDLARMHLKKTIQTGVHDPCEDGMIAYELVRWCIDNGYIKNSWKSIGEKFMPSFDFVIDALEIKNDRIFCVYTRGSRAVGTNKPDSDYDLIVVCDKSCGIIDGTLVRCGNIDLCIYSKEYFDNLVRTHIIWAIEAIYCPKDLVYCEKIDYQTFFQKHQENTKINYNQYLNQSIGYETSRKIASAKKHLFNRNFHSAKKHVFIAFRFVEYGRQIVENNKITDLRGVNHIWEYLKSIPDNEIQSFRRFKELWKDRYIELHKAFNKYTPKKKNTEDYISKRYSYNSNFATPERYVFDDDQSIQECMDMVCKSSKIDKNAIIDMLSIRYSINREGEYL